MKNFELADKLERQNAGSSLKNRQNEWRERLEIVAIYLLLSLYFR